MNQRPIVEFFDRLAPDWDAQLVVDEDKIRRILDAAGVCPGAAVLDVACGTGVLFPFYAQRGVDRVMAVDISPEMARCAAAKAVPGVEVVCGDVEALPPTPAYDCCVVYNAFPHFPDPERLVGSLVRWLRPGGRLTVAHGMGLQQLNAHHAGHAAGVSRGMLPAPELSALFSHFLQVDTVLSDEGIYIVSGALLKPAEGTR